MCVFGAWSSFFSFFPSLSDTCLQSACASASHLLFKSAAYNPWFFSDSSPECCSHLSGRFPGHLVLVQYKFIPCVFHAQGMLQCHTTAPPTCSDAHSQSGFSPSPHLPLPDQYRTRTLGKRQAFLLQCFLAFSQQPSPFITDKSEIAYIMRLLRVEALDWATPTLDNQPTISNSYDNFVSEMRKEFDQPMQGRESSNLSLCQGVVHEVPNPGSRLLMERQKA